MVAGRRFELKITLYLWQYLVRKDVDQTSRETTGGLAELGILAEAYHSNLAGVILTLMGFDLNGEVGEELYAFYDARLTALATLETTLFHEQLETLAESLYQELQARKS